MLCQVHGSPKLCLPQAEDARTTWHDHGVGELLECLPMQEGCHRAHGGKQPGLVGSEPPLLEAEKEVPIDGPRSIDHHHPQPFILNPTIGFGPCDPCHRIFRRPPMTHGYVGILSFPTFSYHLHPAKNVYLLHE